MGLHAAIRYVSALGMDRIAAHEHELTAYALAEMSGVRGLTILGPTEAVDRGGAISFTLDGVHPHDVMQMLDSRGIAIRGGHHCARPLHDRLGVQSSCRASLYLYTTQAEIDRLVEGLDYTSAFFGGRLATAGGTR